MDSDDKFILWLAGIFAGVIVLIVIGNVVGHVLIGTLGC